MESHELKRLQTQRRQVQEKLGPARQKVAELDAALVKARRELSTLMDLERVASRAIEDLVSKDPVVSEQALLRYFERIGGFDLDAVRERILTPGVRGAMKFSKSGKFPADGFHAVVKDGVVVTIEV